MKDRFKIKRFTKTGTSMTGKKRYHLIIEINGINFSGELEED